MITTLLFQYLLKANMTTKNTSWLVTDNWNCL